MGVLMTKDYYQPNDIPRFEEKLGELKQAAQDVEGRILNHLFESEKAKEHAIHGFIRRVHILWRCVRKTFELLPPDLEGKPEEDNVKDATVFLHAFYVNIFGACDNIAWVLAFEKNIRKADGARLPAAWVGIRKNNTRVREMLSIEMVKLLDELEEWFEHIDDFRHSLAHRIPLYVPPYIVTENRVADYERLEAESWAALFSTDLDRYEALRSDKMALTFFRPWFTHSISENSPHAIIHPQLIADFGAILKLSDAAMKEVE